MDGAAIQQYILDFPSCECGKDFFDGTRYSTHSLRLLVLCSQKADRLLQSHRLRSQAQNLRLFPFNWHSAGWRGFLSINLFNFGIGERFTSFWILHKFSPTWHFLNDLRRSTSQALHTLRYFGFFCFDGKCISFLSLTLPHRADVAVAYTLRHRKLHRTSFSFDLVKHIIVSLEFWSSMLQFPYKELLLKALREQMCMQVAQKTIWLSVV